MIQYLNFASTEQQNIFLHLGSDNYGIRKLLSVFSDVELMLNFNGSVVHYWR